MDYSQKASSVHGVFQARKLEWVVISFSRRSSQIRDQSHVSCIAGRFFTIWATSKVHIPIDFSNSGSSWIFHRFCLQQFLAYFMILVFLGKSLHWRTPLTFLCYRKESLAAKNTLTLMTQAIDILKTVISNLKEGKWKDINPIKHVAR